MRAIDKRNILILLFLLLLLAIVSILSIILGSENISLNRFFQILTGKGTGIEKNILYGIRIPRLMLALSIGASLSIAGVLLQAVFRNPLVEPYTTGISGGASFAVSLALVSGLTKIFGISALYLSAFTGAIFVISILYLLYQLKKIKNINTLLLTGIMMSFIFSSLIMLVMALSKVENTHSIIFWLMGSLEQSRIQTSLFTIIISIFLFLIVIYYFHELDALLLGEEAATQLGINVRNSQIKFFLVASILTACSVTISGIIGFVGLAIPIIMRKIIGTKHNYLLIASYLGGALFLSACDLISRTIIAPRELPVGVITGITGGIIFLWTLFKRDKS